MSRPLVSVALPVHNGGPYLAAAVRSILDQTFRDLELVVAENASTDETAEVLAGFSDPRMRVVHSRTLLRMADSHNLAAASARGEFVAFMGADDVAAPERLERQLARFDADPALGLLSSWARMIDETGSVLATIRLPTTDAELRRERMRNHGFLLSSLTLRRALFERLRGFDGRYGGAMDYDLTLRALERTRAANVAAVLLDYRFHADMSTLRAFRSHHRGQLRARWAALRRGAVPLSESVWLFKSLVAVALPSPIGRWIALRKLRLAHGRGAA